MRSLFLTILCSAVVICAMHPAEATVTVKLQTSIGDITFDLDEDAKPATVTNFLRYVRDGFFGSSFAHRLPQGFVLQGGAFYAYNNQIFNVLTYPAIDSEKGPFPAYSNVKGTIAMALSGTGNDTATDSWFINLKDNDGTAGDNLDTLNGGFTVFGKVTAGMAVLDRFAAFTNFANVDGDDKIVDVSGGDPNSPLADLPVKHIVASVGATFDDLIYTNWMIVGGTRPVLTSPCAVWGNVGTPLNYQTTGTGDVTSGAITVGTLPPGLTFDPDTGLVSGTPTQIGNFEITMSITNGTATGFGPILFIIDDALPTSPTPTPVIPLTVTPPGPPKVTTKKTVIGKHGKVMIKGSASSGTVKVEVKAPTGGFKRTQGSPTNWIYRIQKLKPGKYQFKVRAMNATGQSTIETVKATIKS